MISCAPTPSTLTNGPSRCSRTSPTRSSAGNLFGTPNRPTRPVRLAPIPIREDLGRRHRLVALAERAGLLRRRILRIPEGARALGPGRGEHDPGRGCVVFADFWHGKPGAVRASGGI